MAAKKSAAKKSAASRPAAAPAAAAEQPPGSKDYMSSEQRQWFRQRLLDFRARYLIDSAKTAQELRQQEKDLADEIDRANSEFGYVVELRENERLGFLQQKIDAALAKIEDGTYGYCSECGEQIGIKRMAARPVATLCIECKQFREGRERRERS